MRDTRNVYTRNVGVGKNDFDVLPAWIVVEPVVDVVLKTIRQPDVDVIKLFSSSIKVGQDKPYCVWSIIVFPHTVKRT